MGVSSLYKKTLFKHFEQLKMADSSYEVVEEKSTDKETPAHQVKESDRGGIQYASLIPGEVLNRQTREINTHPFLEKVQSDLLERPKGVTTECNEERSDSVSSHSGSLICNYRGNLTPIPRPKPILSPKPKGKILGKFDQAKKEPRKVFSKEVSPNPKTDNKTETENKTLCQKNPLTPDFITDMPPLNQTATWSPIHSKFTRTGSETMSKLDVSLPDYRLTPNKPLPTLNNSRYLKSPPQSIFKKTSGHPWKPKTQTLDLPRTMKATPVADFTSDVNLTKSKSDSNPELAEFSIGHVRQELETLKSSQNDKAAAGLLRREDVRQVDREIKTEILQLQFAIDDLKKLRVSSQIDLDRIKKLHGSEDDHGK